MSFPESPRWASRMFDAPRNRHHVPTKDYVELRVRSYPGGFRREEIVKLDYPFTPAYVASFADSSDYRSDPVGAVAKAPKRKNLGDITDIQTVSNFSSDQVASVCTRLRDALVEQQNSQSSVSDNKGGETE